MVVFGKTAILLLSMGGKSLGAESNDIFWGSLDVDSNVLSIVNTMSDHNFPFQGLVEWQGDLDGSILVSIDQLSLDVFPVFNEELDHANLERLTFRNVHALLVVGLDSHVSV